MIWTTYKINYVRLKVIKLNHQMTKQDPMKNLNQMIRTNHLIILTCLARKVGKLTQLRNY